MSEYGAHVFNTFDSAAMNWGWESDQGHGPKVRVSQDNYINAKDELESYIRSLEDKLVPEGFKVVPIEPTEEMIQAACVGTESATYETYRDWANGHSNGVVEMVRKFEAKSYSNMVGAYNG